jgi:hypothetical protein
MTIAPLLVAAALLQPAPRFDDTAVIPALKRADPTLKTFQTFFKKPIDDGHWLLIVRGSAGSFISKGTELLFLSPGDVVGVFLMDRSNPNRVWELALLHDGEDSYSSRASEDQLTVQRFDATSLVFLRTRPDYGIREGFIKLFFDVRSKRLLKRLDYAIGSTDVVRADTDFCATVKIDESSVLTCMRGESLTVVPTEPPFKPALETAPLPDLPPMPQSTYEAFARARPGRVEHGYEPSFTKIVEAAAAFQIVGDRVWFGKTFDDGEGTTGVGAIGYFDRSSRQYVFVNAPELADWSTSALLVENGVVWIGLTGHPEGEDDPGGLLRYDPGQRRFTKIPIPDVIHTITRWNGALYLGTWDGLYVIRGDSIRRFRVEPGLSGRPLVISENIQ